MKIEYVYINVCKYMEFIEVYSSSDIGFHYIMLMKLGTIENRSQLVFIFIGVQNGTYLPFGKHNLVL